MAEYKDVTVIKMEMQQICDNCWHPHRLGGCPEHCGINDAIKIIDSVPPVDAVPVRRGRWKEDPSGYGFWICSACGFVSEASAANVLYKFCPACGARMDGKGNGNETD